ncbi:histidine phosphatase family protein [Corynebacterium urogenitale]
MRLRVESDGGSRGNPGLAGAGSSVVDPASVIAGEPHELACQWQHIDKATNNVAEYHGLINGLTLAAEVAEKLGESAAETTVDVFMDSKLIVEQMSGRWKIKHPDMKPLAQQVKSLERDFAAVSYTWVPRAQNKRADELANRAMDDKVSGVSFDLPESASSPSSDATNPTSAAPADKKLNEASGKEPGEGAGGVEQKDKDNERPTAPDWHGGRKPTRMLLLRHGETQLSVEKKFSGLGNPELTARGQWQAEQAAAYIGGRGGISTVLSSPLKRARQTAQAVAEALSGQAAARGDGQGQAAARGDGQGRAVARGDGQGRAVASGGGSSQAEFGGLGAVEVIVDDGLREMDFGAWEGKTFAEVRAEYPDEHIDFFYNATTAPPDGESQEDVFNRMREVVQRLVKEHEGQNIVLVSHVTPIKAIIRHALQASGSCFRTMHLDLAGLSVVEFYDDGNSVVRRVNDTHYLEA